MRYPPSTKQVLVFLAVARHLKFLAAAEALNMSQPAVTAQILELERNLGLRLFHRTKREVALTPEGRDLVPMMARIAETLEAVVEASEELGAGRRGRVRIAVLPSVAASILPGAIAGFRAAHPGIEIAVADVLAEEILALVRSGEADFGIGPRAGADRSIVAETFLTDELCAFMPGDHPLAREEAPDLRRCAGFPQVVTTQGSSVRGLLEAALAAEGARIEIALEVAYISTALAAARAGLGIAILPRSAAEAGNAAGLACRRVGPGGLPRQLQILTRRGRDLTVAAGLLRDWLRADAADRAG
ncbi:LysR family transcriptional regulator [Mangrovicoccus algicola]|uniref:LysR family transcriptional regulator n=1 Tax=Mangrovicoccus algicola TaxID=2771008 RepID=A0A8J6YTC8_9RHOB|nr:LysR family transcriptional regulator [Mangrovicoccus algicola]MBE3637285.1 LysR family transcriptional regulator [Mangrovicoccus algicola]